MEDIIDYEKKTESRSLIDLLPAFFVLLIFIWKWYRTQLNFIEFNIPNSIAFALVGISTIIYFYNKSFYVYALLLIFVAGMFKVYYFVDLTFTVGDKLLSINIIALFLLLTHMLVHYKMLNKSGQPKEERDENLIVEDLKNNYRGMSIKELTEIINNKSYREEAKIAAYEIILEKTK